MMKDQNALYQRIKEIADEQQKDNEPISRADLAYALQKDGFDCTDGQQLSKAVYEAYQQFGRSANIREFFLDNNMQQSVVDQYELNDSLDKGDSEKALIIVNQDLTDTKDQLAEALAQSADVLKVEAIKIATGIVEELRGGKEIQDIQSKAANLMQNYGLMIDTYRDAEQSVKDNIHDFVTLRSYTNGIFNKYAQTLVDIFGESIKVVDPKLFDFDSVQYLDVSTLQKERVLDFNRLDETCTLLTGEIATNFKNLLTTNQQRIGAATKGLKLIGSGSKGGQSGSKSLLGANLLLAAFELINHKITVSEKTVRLQREFNKLTDSIKRDKAQVCSDLSRLGTVHKVLNDLYIPRAAAFSRLSSQVLDSDLKVLLDTIYNTDGVKELKEERDNIIAQLSELEVQIADHQENIAYFTARIADDEGILNNQSDNYQQAKTAMPQRPNSVKNAITLGSAKKNYQEKIAVWKKQYGELVEAYEEAQINTSNNKEDLQLHEQKLKEDEAKYKELKKDLQAINKKMMAKIECSPEQKAKALKHLNGLVSLLHAAKTISESKLDDSLIHTTVIANPEESIKLPADVSENLKSFADSLSKATKSVGEAITKEYASAIKAGKHDTTEVAKLLNDNASLLTSNGNQIAAKAASLIEGWLYLQNETNRAMINADVYKKEEERLKAEFQQQMHNIDNQSEALRKILANANTAEDKEVLRQALIDLGGEKAEQLTAEDFDALLRGDKQIEL